MTDQATDTEVETVEVETEEAAVSQTTEEIVEAVEGEEVETLEGDDQTELEGDDLEEIEWDGIKARVPPAIKAGLMRTADYTRKTQELADNRKALEGREAAITQQAAAVEELQADYGKFHALDAQVKAFEAVDWDALDREAANSEDPISAQAEINKLERQYRRLVAERDGAKSELDGKVEERRLQSERAVANAMQETSRQLADPKTGIKGWSQEKAAELANLAATRGVTLDDLKQADTRTWKLLNDLAEAKAENAKLRKATNHATAQTVTPARTVQTGGAFKPGLNDELPMKAWLERRNAQTKKG